MFSNLSRYRNVPTVAALDAKGRTLTGTDIRLLPATTGTYQHTVTAGDRLDHLGYQYYSQSLQWWNICDANPDFLSPEEMLGQGAITTTSFPVSISTTPPWNTLIASLKKILGVEQVRIDQAGKLVAQGVVVAGQTVTTWVEQTSMAVVVRYNRVNLSPADLATAIEGSGFKVAPYTDINQVGRSITVPPKPIG